MRAYLDIVGGISGDMLLGAIVDAGLPIEHLRNELKSLNTGGWSLEAKRVTRGAVPATLVNVKIDPQSPKGLNWSDFRTYIDNSGLTEADKELTRGTFDVLEEAELAAHAHEGKESSDLKLHELGTLDTLIDVAGTIVGLRMLDVKEVSASPLPIATGYALTEHGSMPATALATQAIVRENKVPMRSDTRPPTGESVTPTGAALLAAIANFTPQILSPKSIGHGAGNRNNTDGPPNIVSLWLCGDADGREHTTSLRSGLVLLETNIDNASGELLGHVAKRLMNECALDAWTTPIYMKKNRPAVLLSTLVERTHEEKALQIIMQETPTLGVRRRPVERYEAKRYTVSVSTEFGEIDVKVKQWNNEVAHVSPEYESCRKAGEVTGAPVIEIMRAASKSFYNK